MLFSKVSDSVKRLSLTFALGFFGRNMMWLFLPVFFKMYTDNLFLIGILTSLPAFITIFLDIPIGNLIQRASSRLVMLVGLGAFVLPGALYLTAVPLFFVVGKVFEGVAKALTWESGWYIAMVNSEHDNESESLSVFGLGKSIADVLGPIVGGVVAFYLGLKYNLIFWPLFGVVALIYFYLSLGFSTDNFLEALRSLIDIKTYSGNWKHLKEGWFDFKWPITLILIHGIIFSFFWLAVPLMLEELGANYLFMGLVFGVVAIPQLFQVYFAKLADENGWLKSISGFSLAMAPILFIMSLVSNLFILGGLILLVNLFVSALNPVLHSYFDEHSSDELQGEMVGFLEFFKHIGQALGPFIAGTIASIWSVSASFIGAGLAAIVLAGLAINLKLADN